MPLTPLTIPLAREYTGEHATSPAPHGTRTIAWMFATTLGPLPPLDGDAATGADRVRAAIELQVEAGIGLLTDGGMRPRGVGPLDGWRAAQRLAGDHPVKAIVPGPFLRTRRVEPRERRRAALAAADAVHDELVAFAEAGCTVVQVDEPVLAGVTEAEEDRALFVEAHGRLTAGIGDRLHLHLSLGAGAAPLGDALFDLAYRSFGLDLIGGPDDWRLAVRTPGDRGVVCGAVDPATPGPGDLETAIWAARYAASTSGRGLERVGLTTSPGLERLTPAAAMVKLRILGQAARLAGAPREELERYLDPRALERTPPS